MKHYAPQIFCQPWAVNVVVHLGTHGHLPEVRFVVGQFVFFENYGVSI
ncbi:MAG: hypothetical protein WA734_14755 [Candidatus Acidiferrales bacterium]